MYQITVYGKPIGKPMTQHEAESKLLRLRCVVKGLGMLRVSGE